MGFGNGTQALIDGFVLDSVVVASDFSGLRLDLGSDAGHIRGCGSGDFSGVGIKCGGLWGALYRILITVYCLALTLSGVCCVTM